MSGVTSSLVHPRYKTEYRVRNWREYEQGLRARGDVTIWFSEKATTNWISSSTGARGGQRLYSDLAIETSLTLRTDASVVPDLLNQVSGVIKHFTADGAYDKTAVYKTLTERGARIVVPPTRKARISKEKTSAAHARNETVEAVREVGRRQWRKEAGYHRQARVENTFFRYKQLIGGRLRSRNIAAQATEVGLPINVLNRMLEFGASRSEPIHN